MVSLHVFGRDDGLDCAGRRPHPGGADEV